MERHEVIVVGTGAMGSAALWHLARRGRDVLGLDRFAPPHDRGSSHGASRILRLAYVEHPAYVPLVRRALEQWRQLEAVSGQTLFHRTGSLDMGPADGENVTASVESCVEYDLEHRVIAGAELAASFPAWRLPEGYAANLQPDGGWLHPEACVAALLASVSHRGNEPVIAIDASDGHVDVVTESETYRADQVIVTSGAWIADLVPELAGLLSVERQVVGWLSAADPTPFAPEQFPVFNLTVDEGRYYGFPLDTSGVKLARYHHRDEQLAAPDAAPPSADDHTVMTDFARRYLPGLGDVVASQTCLFTNTPDGDFVIDRHPSMPNVIVCSACSGHGFKFATAIGEVLADMVDGRDPSVVVSWLGLDRFGC